ncbi:hypothetical protein CSHISOI_06416 [Colletotrichum shisoi]|uniref:Uncharacterized protein n=1 Tax=Colletotrichum shisoi TaxID=2078593 RepID=A0A5Q4BR90_9PEZI|nr:hypothetical protein CSHISOI_06416 [Colletotrichum shisoi]
MACGQVVLHDRQIDGVGRNDDTEIPIPVVDGRSVHHRPAYPDVLDIPKSHKAIQKRPAEATARLG